MVFEVKEYVGAPLEVKEYSGAPIHSRREDGSVDESRLRLESDVWVGQELAVPWLSGGYVMMKVERNDHGKWFACSKDLMAPLYFAKDDRQCWTVGGFINLRGLEKLMISR